jgi:hypothetical protein
MRSGPRGVLDGVERPVAFQPCADRVVKDRVERGAVGAHLGPDGRSRLWLWEMRGQVRLTYSSNPTSALLRLIVLVD